MIYIDGNRYANEGDLVQLSASQIKFFIFPLKSGQVIQTHRGVVAHNDLIGKPWGSLVKSHQGNPFYLLKPGILEFISTTKRNTQIMYPKDIGFILLRLNIVPGSIVVEAGTGSGGLTQVLAAYVGDKGHVYSYEIRDEMQNLAKKNLARIGLSDRVSFISRNIQDGFEINNADSVFLDLPNPYDFLPQTKQALKPGGYFGTLLPTTNQVEKLLISLSRSNFIFVDVCEILIRLYQAEPEKLRPVDRMVAHTGYLIFARTILPNEIAPSSTAFAN
jgi:tRNA (adenine57-N1/adenine58-N1)-methyltransferase catalytic subunit